MFTLVMYCLLLFFGLPNTSIGDHFRGGMLSLKPGSDKSEIVIMYRFSYSRNYSKEYFCNDTLVRKATLTQANGRLVSLKGCYNINMHPVPYQCTDYSDIQNWSTGVSNVTVNCNASFVLIGFLGGDWFPVQNSNGGSWSLKLNASLTYRPDVKRINSSPITVMQPLVRILYGCEHTISIPVADPDNDLIRCRWSTALTEDECGGVCTKMTGITLNEGKCSVYLNATDGPSPGVYAVAIQVEDFSANNLNRPHSSIPLQFLIEVFSGNASCKDIPVVTDSAHTKEITEVDIPEGSMFTEHIKATTPNLSQKIVAIETISPPGMIKSPLMLSSDDPSGRTSVINVLWIPTQNQHGTHLFCFLAVTSDGLTSPMTCHELRAGADEKKDEDPDNGKDDKKDDNNTVLVAVIGAVGSIGGPTILALIIVCYNRRMKNNPIQANPIQINYE